MSTFTYRAFDSEGTKITGIKKASSEQDIINFLNQKNLDNYSIFKSQTNYTENPYKNVSPKEIAIFCRQMSVLFFSHITLLEGIVLLSEQTENKQLKIALQEIHEHMHNGYTFAEALSMYQNIFGTYLINMTTIGETSGTLDNVFLRLSEYFDKEYRTRKKLRSAIAYPAILTVMMSAIILLLVVKIIPMFEDILKSMGGEMIGLTKVVFAVSSFIGSNIIIILAVVAIVYIAVYFYIRTDKGRLFYDKLKMKLPVSRFVIARLLTARFARSLAILLKSGVQLINALEDVKNLIDNKQIRQKYDLAVKKIKDGEELSKSLESIGIFPPLFLKMTIIGQTTGHLDEMLEKSAGIFDDEVDESIERITTLIEPILIIALSIIVGIILVSVMIPMTAIMSSIS